MDGLAQLLANSFSSFLQVVKNLLVTSDSRTSVAVPAWRGSKCRTSGGSELPATWAGTACAAVNGGSQRETFCAAL